SRYSFTTSWQRIAGINARQSRTGGSACNDLRARSVQHARVGRIPRLAEQCAMAAVDGLLSLLLAQGADTLVLTEGQVPRLSRGGEPRPLSMPPLLPELVARFIEE